MITNFKIFESEEKPTLNDPQPGDYVICTIQRNIIYDDERLESFLRNNIGKIDSFYQGNPNYFYRVRYNAVVDFDIKYSRLRKIRKNKYEYICEVEQILVWSKNKNDLDIKINANKYNL